MKQKQTVSSFEEWRGGPNWSYKSPGMFHSRLEGILFCFVSPLWVSLFDLLATLSV